MASKKNKKQKGYTLLEILVVVVILGILTYVSVPMYNRIVNKADVSDALHNIDMFAVAEEKHFIQNGTYTSELERLETPLKGQVKENIITTNFEYSLGDIRENNYCIYAKSNSKSYIMAKNYRKHSEVLCSGADCSKIESFVEAGSLTKLCGGTFQGNCDLECDSHRILNAETCSCECKNSDTCTDNFELNPDDCSCVCGISTCPEGLTLNEKKCVCEKASGCAQTLEQCKQENGDNFTLDDKCNCVCGKSEKSCVSRGLILDFKKCECVEGQCDKTLADCKFQYGANFTITENNCCICGLTSEQCASDPTGQAERKGEQSKGGEPKGEGDEIYYLDEEACKCAICEKTTKDCEKTFGKGYVLDPTTCSCKCGLNNEECVKENGINYFFVQEKCSCSPCMKTNDECKKQGEDFILDRETCECKCGKTINECQKIGSGYFLNQGKCQCQCGKTEASCKAIGEGLIFSEKQCECICDKSQDDCKDVGENYVLNSKTCRCECGLDYEECLKNGSNYYISLSKCTCEECKKTNDSCQKENGPGFVVNKRTCQCVCDMSDEGCKKENENFIVDYEKCSCKCGLDQNKCDAIGPNLVFNPDKCQCDCTKSEQECTEIGENFSLNSKTCSCECGLSYEQCLKQGGNYYVSQSKCECAECKITDKQCAQENGENFLLNPEKCRCECSIKNEECKKKGKFFILNQEECNCECALTEEYCNKHNSVLDSSNCDCKCNIDSSYCKEHFNGEFLKDQCECTCGFDDKYCEKTYGEHYILNKETCQCEMGPVDGCELTEQECKRVNENFILDPKKCQCTCGLNKDDCSSGFDPDKCICTCDISDEDCKKDFGQTYFLNEGTCECEKSNCDVTLEECIDQNGANYTLNQSNCSCECGISANDCKEGQIFVNCECKNSDSGNCELSPNACVTNYGHNFIFIPDTCKCECGIDNQYCKENYDSNLPVTENCECICGKDNYFCKRNYGEFYVINDDCECTCGKTEVDCIAEGLVFDAESCTCKPSDGTDGGDCGWTLDKCREYYNNANYVFVEEDCKCKCGLSEYICRMYGFGFDPEGCHCLINNCSTDSLDPYGYVWDEYNCHKYGGGTNGSLGPGAMAFNSTTCQCVPHSCNCTTSNCREENNYCIYEWNELPDDGFFNETICACDHYSNFVSNY